MEIQSGGASLSPTAIEASEFYRDEFVQELFNEMSRTYGVVNVISSFGFAVRWRTQCIHQARVQPGDCVVDLMSGMGELWPTISRRLAARGSITGIDFSRGMVDKSKPVSERLRSRHTSLRIEAKLDDALHSSLADQSADVVTCSFGLKTLTPVQRQSLAREVYRILKPGGRFSFVEISVPPSQLLQVPYLFYLRSIVPLIGKILLGNPDNYRMLGRYTTAFQNSSSFAADCTAAGLDAQLHPLFFGCATSVTGTRPLGGE